MTWVLLPLPLVDRRLFVSNQNLLIHARVRFHLTFSVRNVGVGNDFISSPVNSVLWLGSESTIFQRFVATFDKTC